jgi:SAM-dependent methyltransferase
MRFGTLRWTWERLGRRDPLWAVLTHPTKRDGRWETDEFFRSGEAEIQAALEHARELGLSIQRRRALDFGCGVGRLTQAMATQFDRADGVDISASMLRHARRYNRHPGRCTYHLNVAGDLSLFADASFDFVYTTLVLQHIEPPLSRRYISELIRVLAPGGLLVFQLPSQRSTIEPPPDGTRTMVSSPLPEQALRARLSVDAALTHLDPDRVLDVVVAVENCSPLTWASLPDRRGKRRVFVGYRWRLDEEVVFRLTGRCPIEFDLAPGARTNALLRVTAPPVDGQYVLELDMVQEDVTWFGERGSETLRIPVVVGSGVAPVKAVKASPAPQPTFRVRHPRAYALLRATGVRDAYWVGRRALDRIKSGRDAVVVFFQKRPEIPRWIAWWMSRPLTLKMAMHWVPRAEVLSLIAAAGGTVLHVQEEQTPGYLSCKYWVAK